MKRLSALLLCLALLLGLAGCASPDGTAQNTAEAASFDKTGQYRLSEGGEAIFDDPALASDFVCADNYRVFYEIFVGSFSDSNGDGVGDLRGIINRMDYLNDGDPNSGLSLGVEGLWLTPIFSSPSYHKYDVEDFYTVDPQFGTAEDLKELLTLCHERNVKVILDLPINHTAKRCDWFSRFLEAHRSGDLSDPYYDFYSYYTEGEAKPSGRTFSKLSGTDDYYECNFWDQMPELNYDSEAVRQAVLDVAKYYLELGVDGFRFDAAKYIYFGDNAASVEFWNWYLSELRAINPEIYTVGEVWDSDTVTDRYFAATNCFNFTISQMEGLIAQTAMKGDANRLTGYMQTYWNNLQQIREDAMPVTFIANHDTDRAAGYLPTVNGYMQMAANLYLLAPGSPFIYYGEELGMRGSRGSANTDANRRLAMLWNDGDTVADPEGSTYERTNQISDGVREQLADGGSLYSYYKQLLMIRRANPEIARGTYRALEFDDTKLGGFTSTWEGRTVCVLHNPTSSSVTVDLSSVTEYSFETLAAVIGMGEASLDGTTVTVGPQTSVVLR